MGKRAQILKTFLPKTQRWRRFLKLPGKSCFAYVGEPSHKKRIPKELIITCKDTGKRYKAVLDKRAKIAEETSWKEMKT